MQNEMGDLTDGETPSMFALLRSKEMKLPNGERAIVDGWKLQEYCLNRSIRAAETRHGCLRQSESEPMWKYSGQPWLRPPVARTRS